MALDRKTPEEALAVTRATAALTNTELLPQGFTFAGRYEVTTKIGAGGMGIVYGGLDRHTGREVAIKVLNPGTDTVASRRFQREAELAFGVKHQHLCEILEAGFEGAVPFIVMERLVGETAVERLERDGPLPIVDCVRIMIQVLEALSAAHKTGVIHRDVKPDNVFLLSPPGADPWSKLIDFGVAKALGETRREDSITETDTVPGTPSFFSPEQLAAEEDLDGRVDVWASGVTLFAILTGRRPFEGKGYAELMMKILREPPVSIIAFRPEVPVALERVIDKALEKAREDRYPTATAMRAALVELLARGHVATTR